MNDQDVILREWPEFNFAMKLSEGVMHFPGLSFQSLGDTWENINSFFCVDPRIMFEFKKARNGVQQATKWTQIFLAKEINLYDFNLN